MLESGCMLGAIQVLRNADGGGGPISWEKRYVTLELGSPAGP